MPTIEVKNLKKYFGKIHAIDDISFSVEKGEIFGFLGPNGAGKTTTIRCLLDFLRPTSGEINILTKDKIGYLSGDVRLYDGWTGEEHISFVEGLRNSQSIARDLAEKLSLNLKIRFKNLSSGNKQKLGLVLALGFQPELLIMDEPTVGLDPLLQNMIYKVLEDFQKNGTTIFLSSHNLSEVDRLCHRVGVIRGGKIVAIETIQALKEKRMHVVKIDFNGPYNVSDFNLENVVIKNQLPESLILGVKGDINPLIKRLANYNLKEIETTHATLEEIFLEFYGDQKNQQIQQSTTVLPTKPIPPSQTSSQSDNNYNEIPKLE